MAFFPEEKWTTALNHLGQQIRPHFVRPECHQRALVYLQGLTLDASRKNAQAAWRKKWERPRRMRSNTC